MKASSILKSSLLVAVAALLATGCVVRERVVYATPPVAPAPDVVVTEDMPAPYVEVMPAVPRPGFVWVQGAWVWRHHWVWVRGHWEHPPRPEAVWIGGRYEYRGGARVWIGGYWR
jgi:hypothetical protein